MKLDVIYQGDCLEVMKQFPDKSMDMILCDLPYGTTACSWDTIIPLEPLWKEYKRMVKDNAAIVLTACQPFTSKLVMSNLEMFKYEWIWDKKLPSGALNANHRPLRRHENILVFSKGKCSYLPKMKAGKKRWVGGGGQSECYGAFTPIKRISTERYPTSILSHFGNADNSNKVHPTQKPVALFRYLIETYTKTGDVVLDNCVGSGTTCVAAAELERHYIGIELNPDYIKLAEKRLSAIQQRLVL